MIPSLQSRILTWMLKIVSFNKRVEKMIQSQLPGRKRKFIPKRIKNLYLINHQNFSTKIVTFECKEKVSKIHIIFLHGGAYVFEASKLHWRFAEKIVKKSFCRMTLLDYPLAPEHNYKVTFKMIGDAYDFLIDQYPEDNFILMGDSAGGGLALAFTQKLINEKHLKLPCRIVLLSPWLDLTMSNSNIKNLESSDYILTVKMLRDAGMKYSDGDNQDQYLLSPINGKFEEIPETLVFYGTEEIFNADCVRLKSIIGSNKQRNIFREYDKMQHDWAIFPIPESNEVINEIYEFIK